MCVYVTKSHWKNCQKNGTNNRMAADSQTICPIEWKFIEKSSIVIGFCAFRHGHGECN